jgi:hypothetical protein
MNPIQVHPAGCGFCEKSTGLPFTPWGCNYYDPDTGWPPCLWALFDADRVRAHFDHIRAIGGNVVRVFASVANVLAAPDRVNPAGLAKMERMLELAEAAGRLKAWGRAFAGLAPAITPRLPVRQAGTRTLPLPWAELLTDAERIKDFPAAYLEVCRHGEVVNFEPSE